MSKEGIRRPMQSHPVIDSMQDSACCLLCGTLEDPFVGCEHKAEMLYESMRNVQSNAQRVE